MSARGRGAWYRLAACVLVVTLATSSRPSVAAEVSYLGAITDNLHAPTALYVSSDVLAVLEPYAQELAVYTPEGFKSESVHISGWVTGLQRLSGGEYIFCDTKTRQVLIVNTDLQGQTTFLDGSAQIEPSDVLYTSGQIYILDAKAKSLNRYNVEGTLLGSRALVNGAGESIGFPSALAHDPLTGRFFVFDQTRSHIWMLDAGGEWIATLSGFGSGSGEITRGGAMRCDRRGLLYVSDRYQGRIVVFNTYGEFVTHIDLESFGEGRLKTPIGVALDESDILYVSSTEGASIHMFKVDGYAGGSSLQLRPLFPGDQDTVAADATTLRVESLISAELITSGVFEFELYDTEDTASAPQTVSISADDAPVGQSGGAVAEWRPGSMIQPGGVYRWRTRLNNAELEGPWSAMRTFTVHTLPQVFSLGQNYPNPFNPSTQIEFSLAHDAHVTLTVFNLLGQKVVTLLNETRSAGPHQIRWDSKNATGRPVGTGVYFYRMQAAEYSTAKKMVIIK